MVYQDFGSTYFGPLFEKYAGSAGYRDVSVTLTPGDYTFSAIRLGSTALTLGTHYTVNSNDYTINKDYLAAFAVGTHRFVFEMDGGNNPVLIVAVIQSTPGALTGTATINNTSPKISDVLTASLAGGNNTGTLHYVWTADGTAVGTNSSTYTMTATDLGKRITVEVGSSVESGTVTSDATSPVVKKDYADIVADPELASKTHNSVTLKTVAGYEYAYVTKDGAVPTAGFVTASAFTGLSADMEYDFYQRAAETPDTNASALSARLTVKTDAATDTVINEAAITGVTAPAYGGSPCFRC